MGHRMQLSARFYPYCRSVGENSTYTCTFTHPIQFKREDFHFRNGNKFTHIQVTLLKPESGN
jgi:hypothetical protein